MGVTENAGKSTVAVPAVDVPSTVACLRSLGSSGVNTVVVTERETAATLRSSFCDEVVSVPDPKESLLGYKDALVDVAARNDVRTIIPVRETDVYVLARYREEFTDHVSLVTPSLDTLHDVHDRLRLVEAAEEAGVPVPETRLLGDVENWTGGLLIKSRYNLVADAYVDSLSPDEVLSTDVIEHVDPEKEPDCEALCREMGHEPIVQEHVPRESEYMVGALYDHGTPVATFQHRQIRGASYVGSGGVYRESVDIPELESVSRALLDHLDWHGLACIEYVQDADTGEFKLAEINPRMWQSLASTVRMGADFPAYYWLQATGQSDRIDPEYDVGVGCHWLKGEFLHVLNLFRDDSPFVERPRLHTTLRDITTSCFRQPNFDYLSLDDPWPFFQDWRLLLDEVPGISRLNLRERGVSGYDGGDLEDGQPQ